MKLNFTKAVIDELPTPDKGQKEYSDSQENYLIIRCSPTTKSFYYKRKYKGTSIKDKIDNYPDCSIFQARKKCQQISAEVLTGEYFRKRSRTQLDRIFKRWDAYNQKHIKKPQQEAAIYKRAIQPVFGDRAMETITKSEVSDWHIDIGSESESSANRCLDTLNSIFNWAMDQEIIDITRNPCKIKKFEQHSRERFLSPEEVVRFFHALYDDGIDPETKTLNKDKAIPLFWQDFFTVLLFMGYRRGAVQKMKLEQLDFEQSVWNVPAELAKNNKKTQIVLSEKVVDILQRRIDDRQYDSQFGWIWPSPRKRNVPVREPKKTWAKIIKNANVPNFTMHDLRRTMASWQARGGASLLVISKSLGHKDTRATEIYARLDLDPVRESVAAAGAELERLIPSDEPLKAEVVLSEVDDLKAKIQNIDTNDLQAFKQSVFALMI